MEHFGRIDILINNAGIFVSVSVEDAPMDQLDHILSTNLKSAVAISRLLRIIVVHSRVGGRPS